ncbi:MAG: DUF922 domain-containing Zn-dependent protease [Chitinophagaceae bacterium]|nr:DUF922 domain-containing Zn-dependent protease [Chitinophagaceae bacterium]
MFRVTLLLWIWIMASPAPAQTVLVKGRPHSGQLSWADFTGPIPAQSKWDAYTAVKVSPAVEHVLAADGLLKANKVEVTVALDSVRTWVRPGKETDGLLQHEQGHLNLYLICAREMENRLWEARFTPEELNSQLKNMVNDIMAKSKLLNERYDAETRHYRNQHQQQVWTARINAWLEKGSFPEVN